MYNTGLPQQSYILSSVFASIEVSNSVATKQALTIFSTFPFLSVLNKKHITPAST